jgi:AraC family transcriptional regulator, regulatory protein of adaptative response / methylated-DNA-[protein]-cysteine methyltransferase
LDQTDYQRIEKAIRYLEDHFQDQPSLEEVAQSIRLSPFYFQRLFQRWAGISPKGFLQYLTVEYAKERLRESRSVLDAAFDAGLSAPSRLHDLFVSAEAMTPGEFKLMGKGLQIEYGTHPTPFGLAMAALTSRGVCGFSFLTRGSEKPIWKEMKANWPEAHWVRDNQKTLEVVKRIFNPALHSSSHPVRILLKGTPFQLKVWEALLRIPPGSVMAYQDIARMVDKPKASRAVGTAVGQNAIAYLIPCHRVIRETGVLGEYRWGSARKKILLAWEGAKAQRSRPSNSPSESTDSTRPGSGKGSLTAGHLFF